MLFLQEGEGDMSVSKFAHASSEEIREQTFYAKLWLVGGQRLLKVRLRANFGRVYGCIELHRPRGGGDVYRMAYDKEEEVRAYGREIDAKVWLLCCAVGWPPAEQVLRNSRLPDKECDFFTALTDYFPCFFDIKVRSAVSLVSRLRLWDWRREASESSASSASKPLHGRRSRRVLGKTDKTSNP
jgi:hypothetical protein